MMMVDTVDWLPGLIGGGIIGLASALLLFANGKIAGISGIIGGLFDAKDKMWRGMFLTGLVVGGLVVVLQTPSNTMFSWQPDYFRIVLAASLVGIGTAVGSGCTSGHGVCGISRFSKRSIIATITFMTTGFLTLWIGG